MKMNSTFDLLGKAVKIKEGCFKNKIFKVIKTDGDVIYVSSFANEIDEKPMVYFKGEYEEYIV